MASLGYWIGQPHTRRGYMTEGLSCACRFAFETLNLHRLEAACLPHNRASRALLLKSGFREEGLARRYLRINGEWQDHVLFGILRDDVRSATP
jgi:ribosomal-protein-alanine N-acetyltransferase